MIRTRYLLEFGAAPEHQWYSSSVEDLLKDFAKLERKFKYRLFEVREELDETGAVVERQDKRILQ